MRLAIAITMFMFATSVQAAPPTDIDWYLAHPGPRDRVIATCDEDTERLAKDPDCIDAREAEARVPPTDFFDDVAHFFGNLL